MAEAGIGKVGGGVARAGVCADHMHAGWVAPPLVFYVLPYASLFPLLTIFLPSFSYLTPRY